MINCGASPKERILSDWERWQQSFYLVGSIELAWHESAPAVIILIVSISVDEADLVDVYYISGSFPGRRLIRLLSLVRREVNLKIMKMETFRLSLSEGI
jgi:hypothetical protein